MSHRETGYAAGMRLSIRYQLLLPLLAMVAGVAALTAWTAWSAAARVRGQIAAQLDGVADTVQAVAFPLNVQTLRLMKGLSGAEFLVCDTHGQPLAEQGQPLTTLATLPAQLPEASGPDADLPLGARVEVDGSVFLCRGVTPRSELGANRVVYIFYPESLLDEAIAAAVRPAVIVGLIVGAAAIALTLVLTRRIAARITDLGRRTRSIADGDFSPMPLPGSNDELRDLGRAINEMAQRLARFEETLKSGERLRLLGQVSGGLAHQLRNGVAGAKLALQLHAREQPDAEALAVALRQLHLVELQLKRFLDLGKAMDLRLARCDLSTLVADAVELIRPRCRHAGIELRWTRPAMGIPVQADAEHLGQVVLNLVANAIEAAGPGGWIDVRAGAEQGRAVVEVRDSGPGVDPKIAARLFEPFATGKPEGIGLGLAVARQIMTAHGGTVTWSRDTQGTCFRCELPLPG